MKTLQFRNYVPMDESLGSNNTVVTAGESLAYSSFVIKGLEERLQKTKGQLDQLKIAPKKINWDLKRDMAKSLAKLNRQTQRAIISIVEEEQARLAEESGSEESDSEESDSEQVSQ